MKIAMKPKNSRFIAVLLSCLLVLNTFISIPAHAATTVDDAVNPPQATTAAGKTEITSWNYGAMPVINNGDIAATSGYYNNATTLLQLYQGDTPTKVTAISTDGNKVPGFYYSTASLKCVGGFDTPSYWLVKTSSKGFKGLVFNFTTYSAQSGPRDFDTEWSTDGTDWKPFGEPNSDTNFTVMNQSSTTVRHGMNLPPEAANQDVLYIRVVERKFNGKFIACNSSAVTSSAGTNINGLQLYGAKDPAYTTPQVTSVTDVTKPILDATPITLSCTDSNAQIFYTTDGTTPAKAVSGTTKLYSAPFTAFSEGGFNGTNPFVVKAIAIAPGKLASDEVTLSYTQQTITSNLDAKKLSKDTYAWVKGVGTYLTKSSNNASAVYDTLYIQDGMNKGSGLCIFKSKVDLSSYVGKEIYVYGKASPYNGLMEIVPNEVNKTNIVERNATPIKPTPTKIMFDQLTDRSYEGMLVSFDTVKLEKIGGTDASILASHTVSQAGIQNTLRANGIPTSVAVVNDYVNIKKAVASYYNGIQILSTKATEVPEAPEIEKTTTPTVEFIKANVSTVNPVPLNTVVNLSTPTAGATITYSLNGGASVTSTENSVDVTLDSFLNGKATISVTASKGSYTTAAQTFTYTQSKANSVTANPISGSVVAGTQVALSTTTPNATIVYSIYKNSNSSTDGVLVGNANQTYTTPITLDAANFPIRIEAKATLPNYLDSEVVNFNYTAKKIAGGEKNYYGQIHGHTAENSDGQGTLAEANAYARDEAHLDYFILTDHSNSFDKASADDTVATIGNLNTYNTTNQQWLNGKNAAEDAIRQNADKTYSFISDYAYEMTWSGGPGHINTFNTQGFVSRNNKVLNNKTNDAGMQAYYQLLKNTPGSISQFNHPGPTFGNFANFGYYDPEIDKKMNLVEVGNGEGAVLSGGYFRSIDQYVLALDKGWHVAPTNNGDNHKKGWGTSNTCATVVYTNDFTMAGIYQAMQDRSVWATENKNLDVTYYLNDGTNNYSMGAILNSAPSSAQIKVTAKNKKSSEEASNIASIQIRSNSGRVIAEQKYAAGSNDVTYTLPMTAPVPGYYFAQITDNQGFIAVTAPIWLGSAPKAGITSVDNDTVMPVTTDPLKLTTTFFNNENTAVTLKSVSYKVDGDTGANKDYTIATNIPSLGSASHEFTYTPTTPGDKTVSISAVITVNGVDTTYTATSTMKVADINKVLYVGLDGAHGNEYVSGGRYPSSMRNMMVVAADNNIRIVQFKTAQELINACSNPKFRMIILNAPTRNKVAPWPTPTNYSADEIAALKTFSENGNTLVFGNLADYSEKDNYDAASPKKHMSELQNEVLSAIGSTLRASDDEVMDDDKNGGQAFRLYPTEFNMSNPLLEGVVDGQTYSQYSGSTIYAVDPKTGERTSTLPSTVSPLVFGFPTTYSAECDNDNFGYGTTKPSFPFVAVGSNTTDKGLSNADGLYIPKYVNPNSTITKNPEEKLLAASETVIHPNGKKSLVVAAGGSFMSNFEIQVALDNIWTLPYANINIMDNLYKTVNPLVITSIADAKNLPDGTEVVIEGTSTAEVNTQSTDTNANKGFFDCIYAQDATGGINLFPVASGIKEGQKARFYGKITHYQGEVELTVTKFTILDENINKVAPTSLTSKASMLPANTGLLVKTQGTVSNVLKDSDGTINQFTIDDGTGPAIVFINGYITKGTTLPFIKDGTYVSVTGLASIGEVVSDSDMHARIRVRDRGEITLMDGTAPIITITGVEDGKLYNNDVTPVFSADKGTVTATLNGKEYKGGAITADGKYELVVNAAGLAGNNSEKKVSFTIDKTAPIITVTGVENGSRYVNASVKPVITASEDATITVTLDDKAYSGAEIKAAGSHKLTVTAVDKAGNKAVKEISFVINVVVTKDADKTAEAIKDIVTSSKPEEKVVIRTEDTTVVDKKVFEAIKGIDKEVSFVTESQGKEVIWTFNGKDIKTELIADLDLSLKTVTDELKDKETAKAKVIVGKDVEIATFSFTYDGLLPGKANVKIFIGKEWANRTVNVLRYFADKNTYEVAQKDVAVDAEGYMVFTTEHCSDYFVMDTTAISSDKLPKTGSPVDFNVLVGFGALIAALGGYMFVSSRRRRKKFNA